MLKHELVKRIAHAAGRSEVDVREVLDAALAVTCKAVSRGESVMLFGLGKIRISERGEKRARNIWTGESVTVPPRRVVVLQPSEVLNRFANPKA